VHFVKFGKFIHKILRLLIPIKCPYCKTNKLFNPYLGNDQKSHDSYYEDQLIQNLFLAIFHFFFMKYNIYPLDLCPSSNINPPYYKVVVTTRFAQPATYCISCTFYTVIFDTVIFKQSFFIMSISNSQF
jgi:hypothetical protein